MAVVLRKYIQPVFPISRSTLYKALNTDIEAELKKINETENQTL